MREIYIEVPGVPIPQGSLRALTSKAGKPFVIHSNPALKPWREAVSSALQMAFWGQEAISGAVEAYFAFSLPKPKTAKRHRPYVKPDLDKLVRAALDACTMSKVIFDDCQVCRITATKVYCFEGQEPKMKLHLKALEEYSF